MVLNHTSDKHQWFIDAASSRTNPKHDWYVWNDGKPGDTRRTLQSASSTKAASRPITGFRSSVVRPGSGFRPSISSTTTSSTSSSRTSTGAIRRSRRPCSTPCASGLTAGVAGFRLDAIPNLFEDPQLRNERELGGINAQGDPILDDSLTNNLPEVHDVIRRMRAMVDKYPGDRVLIGETYLPNTAELDKWYGGAAHNELQLPMDMLVGFHGDPGKLDAANFRKHIEEVETQVHGSQPLLVFDNHDNVRAIDRYGDGVHDDQINKLLATVLFTSRATALMYYGEEIGMPTTTPTRREDVKDPIGITGWPKEKGRDGERTPMQWDAGSPGRFQHQSSNLAADSPELQDHQRRG